MSVYVSDFGDGTTWTVTHDDAGHRGEVAAADVRHMLGPDGTEDHNYLVIVCPVCGAVSTHPVGGGAQPELVQQMFVNKVAAEGCSCGQVQATDSAALGDSHVHLQCARMDGPTRWKL